MKTKKAPAAKKAAAGTSPKFGSPAWQAKFGRGKAKADTRTKMGK